MATIFRFKIDGIEPWKRTSTRCTMTWLSRGHRRTTVLPQPRPSWSLAAGVIAITRKTTLSACVRLLDTYEQPSARLRNQHDDRRRALERLGSASATGPGTLSAILGQVIPSERSPVDW